MAAGNRSRLRVGLMVFVVFAVVALGLILIDSGDDSQLEENNLAAPIDELDDAEPVESPENDDSMIEKGGPYQ